MSPHAALPLRRLANAVPALAAPLAALPLSAAASLLVLPVHPSVLGLILLLHRPP